MKRILLAALVCLLVLGGAAATALAEEEETTVVTANAEVSYTVIIPKSVDFEDINKKMEEQTKDFTVGIEDALLESGGSVTIENTTAEMVMKDKDGTGTVELPFALGQDTFVFTEDGSIESSISCSPSQLTVAGSYKGSMTFTITYDASGEGGGD